MKRFLFIVFFILFSHNAKAVWISATGKVENMSIYSSTRILVKLENQNGAPVQACSNNEFFIIPAGYSEDSRDRMYSTLLAAKMAGATVSISYEDVGNCEPWGVTPNVYRRIVRLTI
ncbi:hypothetical protein [Pseudoalteromonas arabiensis]|uniref:hypothetical protein n=1 Tax=Pseudoalteromonas arabiensis TaxID=874454 RepID=UPI0007866586|nr:hypothetical protein [Pseudoalteromonas arabiensis]